VEHPEGDGAVVLIRNSLYDVAVVEGVRRGEVATQAAPTAPVQAARPRLGPFAEEELVPVLIEEPSELVNQSPAVTRALPGAPRKARRRRRSGAYVEEAQRREG
jgi:hypothetical protein